MKKIFIMMMLVGITSCAVEPEPINYGRDACHFCEMTIVSKAHAARAVSDKGKQYKYDAIECMAHDELKHQVPMAIRQVSDLADPGSMIEVEDAVFLVNDSINSPMGANLGALKENHETSKNAELYSWEELISFFRRQDSMSLHH